MRLTSKDSTYIRSAVFEVNLICFFLFSGGDVQTCDDRWLMVLTVVALALLDSSLLSVTIRNSPSWVAQSIKAMRPE